MKQKKKLPRFVQKGRWAILGRVNRKGTLCKSVSSKRSEVQFPFLAPSHPIKKEDPRSPQSFRSFSILNPTFCSLRTCSRAAFSLDGLNIDIARFFYLSSDPTAMTAAQRRPRLFRSFPMSARLPKTPSRLHGRLIKGLPAACQEHNRIGTGNVFFSHL